MLITQNSSDDGGGIYCQNGSNPAIANCVIADNTTSNRGGGIHCIASSPRITNCLIMGNSAVEGGGLMCTFSSSPTITNCTITSNTASNYGGGTDCHYESSLTIANSILWENNAPNGPEIAVRTSGYPSTLTVSYSDAEGGEAAAYVESGCTLSWDPGSDIDLDPLFLDPDNADYHLSAGSPCIDAGDNDAVPPEVSTDLDGDARIVDGDDDGTATVDMGAYERQPPAEYFVHIADTHVWSQATDRWDRFVTALRALSPRPEFVLCAGDLVEWGAGLGATGNYEDFKSPLYCPSLYECYLDDSEPYVPIYACPGKHDYRKAWQVAFFDLNLTKYKEEIHSETYYHVKIGDKYAIFSIESGHDDDIIDSHPEGTGLDQEDLIALETDLEDLDGEDNDTDTSAYKKIIMMHHPHLDPEGEDGTDDGTFLHLKPEFKALCEQYGVHWVLYGHVHPPEDEEFNLDGGDPAPGETKCIIVVAAEDGGYRRESLDTDRVGRMERHTREGVVLWSVINVTIHGNVEACALEDVPGGPDRTGRVGSDVVLGIGGSLYKRYDHGIEGGVLTHMSVYKEDSRDYTFEAEALAPGAMSLRVLVRLENGTYSDALYENVPMYHNGFEGSVATLSAPQSVVDYMLTVNDPDGGVRYIWPSNLGIPTVSEWGMVVMTLLVLAAGTLVFVRRWPARA